MENVGSTSTQMARKARALQPCDSAQPPPGDQTPPSPSTCPVPQGAWLQPPASLTHPPTCCRQQLLLLPASPFLERSLGALDRGCHTEPPGFQGQTWSQVRSVRLAVCGCVWALSASRGISGEWSEIVRYSQHFPSTHSHKRYTHTHNTHMPHTPVISSPSSQIPNHHPIQLKPHLFQQMTVHHSRLGPAVPPCP